jgi:hypothetical protein
MNPLTIWGTVAKAGDVSAHYRASGAVDSAHSILRDETTLPDDGIQITLCHDDQVVLGELTYAELDDQQTLRAVAVIDGPLTESLAAFPGDLYWSAELSPSAPKCAAATCSPPSGQGSSGCPSPTPPPRRPPTPCRYRSSKVTTGTASPASIGP